MKNQDETESSTGWNKTHIISAAVILGCAGLAFLLNQIAPGPAAEDAYASGTSALQEKKYQDANDAFSKVIRLNPDNTDAYFGRALALRHLDDNDAAKADYDTVLSRAPDNGAAHYNRGLIFTDLNKPDEAIADFIADARLSPQDPDPHLRLAELYRATGDFDHALAERNILIDMRGRRLEDYLERSALRRDFGDLDGAIGDLDAAIGTGAGSYDAFLNRGLLRRAKGDSDGALADFAKAISLKPEGDPLKSIDPRAHVARGETLLAAGHADAAKAEFDDMIKRSPDSSPGYASRGMLALFVPGDAAAAATDLDTAVKKSFENRDSARLFNEGFREAMQEEFHESAPEEPWRPEVAPNVPFAPTIYYYVVWRHLAHQRAGQDDSEAFSKDLDKFDFKSLTEVASAPPERTLQRVTWPAPVLALFAGKTTPDIVRRTAAAEPAPAVRRQQQCEADFFLAEYSLFNKNGELDAQKLLRAAVDECPQGAREKVFAKLELERLSAPSK